LPTLRRRTERGREYRKVQNRDLSLQIMHCNVVFAG
jgi:hypothetical protein